MPLADRLRLRMSRIPDESVRLVLLRHLKAARHFILLASPAAAQSYWVQFEIESWLSVADTNRMLLVLLEGEIHWSTENKDFDWDRTSALPRALAGHFPSQPLYADLRLRSARETQPNSAKVAKRTAAQLASVLDGIAFDELLSRDNRRAGR